MHALLSWPQCVSFTMKEHIWISGKYTHQNLTVNVLFCAKTQDCAQWHLPILSPVNRFKTKIQERSNWRLIMLIMLFKYKIKNDSTQIMISTTGIFFPTKHRPTMQPKNIITKEDMLPKADFELLIQQCFYLSLLK